MCGQNTFECFVNTSLKGLGVVAFYLVGENIVRGLFELS
jgi:hypothetical protein